MDHPRGAKTSSFKFAEHMRDIAAIYSLRERRFDFLNAAAEVILGLPRSAILDDASLLFQLVVEEDRPRARAFHDRAVREGRADVELRIRRPDGGERRLAVRAYPTESGRDDTRALICEDVSESRRIELALSESEARFCQVVENIEEVFWIVSPDGTQVYYASPTYQRIWGRPATELYSSPFKWMQSVHPEDQARVIEAVMLRQAEGPLEMYFRIQRGDEIRHIRRRSVPVRNEQGQLIQIVCLSEDVTEQKRLEQQAEESARTQRDALVREVHHRIKNNLQGVTGMLRNYANQHAEVSEVISEAIAQVQAVAIIYGLQGRPGIARIMLDDVLKEVILGIGQLMHRSITLDSDEHNVNCRLVVNELEAVPIALVLNEIVFNAAKHSDPDAELRIELRIDIARERAFLKVSNPGRLEPAVTSAGQSGGSGLKLIQSLLPRRGARFELNDNGETVVARLALEPPVVTLKC
ncbi:MAG TPA: PAS domain-containing protein [Rhodocyclaceae bacterium]